MSNRKATKRALLTSVMALVMCVVMLVGTTFAWFTDTASTGVNKIQAGNLKVDIVKSENGGSIKGESMSFVNKDGADDILWEPGVTFRTAGFQIKNDGNLALKYKLALNGVTGSSKLLEVIKFSVVTEVKTDNGSTFEAVDIDTFEGHLGAGETSDTVLYIQGHMDENAGNDYQNLELTGLGITVYATQDNVESDSFGPNYDKDATYYPVLDAAGMKDALVNGGNIMVDANIAPDRALVATKETTIDMNGKTVENTADIWGDDADQWSLISAQNGAELTITGNGTFQAKENDCYAVDVQDGATVTIENGTFVGNIHAVYVLEGTAYIKGGFYSVQQKYPDVSKANEFVLNCYDANREAGTAKIIVTGGTFVNFNPADCQAEGAHTNFVADGYSVISEKHGEDTWYTVVKGTGATVGTQSDLDTAISGSTVATVKLTEKGTYTLPSLANKDVTIIGTKDTVIDLSRGAAHNGATIALEGVTVKGQTSGDFEGLQHTAKVVYKDCAITGKQTLYANDVEFINCTFDSGADYAIWTYGAKNATFTDCKFNSTNNGKSVLCYSVLSDQTFTRTFNNCTFTATGTKDKSAIMINPTESSGGINTYVVNINNCTATGYTENGISGQTIVGLRNAGTGVIDTITVNIDGTTVYTHKA